MEYPYQQQEGSVSMSSYFELLKSLGGGILSPALQDIFRSLPDSLFLGSVLFGLLTQNTPFIILSLAVAELGILQRVMSGIFSSIGGGISEGLSSDICILGIPSPYQLSIVTSLLSKSSFPSGPVFLVSGIIVYLLLSLTAFSEELEELSKSEPEWKTRIPIGLTLGGLLLISYILWRFINSCESLMPLMGSVLLGLFSGGIVYYVHYAMFGKNSVNFLGLPLLANRNATGAPIYACAKTSQ